MSFSTKLLFVTLATVGSAIAIVRAQKRAKFRKASDEREEEKKTGT